MSVSSCQMSVIRDTKAEDSRTITYRTRQRTNPARLIPIIVPSAVWFGFQIATIRLTLMHQGSPFERIQEMAVRFCKNKDELALVTFEVFLLVVLSFLSKILHRFWMENYGINNLYIFIHPDFCFKILQEQQVLHTSQSYCVYCYSMTCKFES